jgi:hypothetical protein
MFIERFAEVCCAASRVRDDDEHLCAAGLPAHFTIANRLKREADE